MTLRPGDPTLLGATPVEGGVNFALFSANATRVELCLFSGGAQIARHDLPARDGDIWHGVAPGLSAGQAYGYRVHGPYAPQDGHRFNPAKLLMDPYAKAVTGANVINPANYGYRLESGDDSTPDGRDSAPFVHKGLVVDPATFSPLPAGPRTPWRETLLYEAHVKGFTMGFPGLSEAERGRFAGLARGEALAYLKALGVTAIELLPIASMIHDDFLVQKGLKNFWAYNQLNYFSPNPDYCGNDPVSEVRQFVRAAHETGIEVILDVVYNHCCEGSHRGPTLSFRGIDNARYYRLNPQNKAHYADISGCGATLDADEPMFRRLVLDSLAHWVEAYGVDGFRFDIATSLGVNRAGAFSPEHPFFHELRADARLKDAKLIAEAWDAAGGFHVGNFPPEWSEWNAKARDAIRMFWRADEGRAGKFANRFAGSPDLYGAKGRPVRAGVTYVASHDDFPGFDLVRYKEKHNHANGEDNRDGSSHPLSDNYGVEGETADPAILAVRERQGLNLLASALLSFGTPMLLAGDEFGRTQGGNNNAYAQDNAISWLDWTLAQSPLGKARIDFIARVTALRRAMQAGFPEGWPARAGGPCLAWWSLWGEPMADKDWADPQTRALAATLDPGGWLILFNASPADVRFRLPATAGARWRSLLDTADPAAPEGALLGASGEGLIRPGRSLLVMQSGEITGEGRSGHAF
jgi:isoamylase